MKLTQQEKADLKLLVDHQGFKVVEALVNELELTTLRSIKNINLADEAQRATVNATQNYLAGVEGLFQVIKGQAQDLKKTTSYQDMI